MYPLLIIHKIVLYVNTPKIVKLFFSLNSYHQLIISSNAHFDDLFKKYGTKYWLDLKNLRSLQSVIRHNNMKYNVYFSPLIKHFASYGHLDCIVYLFNYLKTNKCDDDDQTTSIIWFNTYFCAYNTIDSAAENGHLHVIQWLYENVANERLTGTKEKLIGDDIDGNDFLCSYQAGDRAATNGHLNVLKWLYQCGTEKLNNNRGFLFTDEAMDMAATNGHLEVVKWLHHIYKVEATKLSTTKLSKRPQYYGVIDLQNICSINALNGAAKNGHFEIIKWLMSNQPINMINNYHRGNKNTSDAIDLAAENGHLEIVKFLCQNNKKQGSCYAMDMAAKNGHFEIIKILHDYHNPCSANAIHNAIINNHVEIIDWLYKNRPECNSTILGPTAIQWAAKNGNLKLVKWIHSSSPTYFYCTNCAIEWTCNSIDLHDSNDQFNTRCQIVKFLVDNCKNNSKKSRKNNGRDRSHSKSDFFKKLHRNGFQQIIPLIKHLFN